MPRISRATRELQWQGQWVPTPKGGGNLETLPQLGSRAATRPREHGMPSNRASSPRGEYVPAPCTHRPSFHPSGVWVRRGLVGPVESKLREEGKVVTRWPYGNLRPDHLLRKSQGRRMGRKRSSSKIKSQVAFRLVLFPVWVVVVTKLNVY